LTGLARELWNDAAAHLKAMGRDARAYRHALAMVCRVYAASMTGDDIGINRLEACRRWLREMGLTPGAVLGAEEVPADGQQQGGRARILALLDRKEASR
jgi:hypothetical protein